MTLDAPTHLLALLAIPAVAAIAALARKRRRRYAVRFPATAVFARVAGDQPRLRRILPPALLAAAAAASAIALAKPEATVAVPVEKASVVLVTDESGSMAASDVDPSRLAAAQSAAKSFLGKVPDSLLVGFVGFSSQTNTVVEPTLEHDRVTDALDSLRADGGTATGEALTAALDRLEARRGKDGKRAPAAVILLSDGKRTEGSDPLAAAQRAKQLGIPVSTVALGTADGTLPGAERRSRPGPARPRDAAGDQPHHRRHVHRSGERRRALERLQEARLEGGDQARQARDQLELRRGEPRAPARRPRHRASVARAPPVTGCPGTSRAPRARSPGPGPSIEPSPHEPERAP
jgi:Ca-activated chloride channel homolog